VECWTTRSCSSTRNSAARRPSTKARAATTGLGSIRWSLAGAGIRAGTVYGASDNSAAYPTDRPHDPKDLAATIYHLLGVDPHTELIDRIGRPYTLVIGKPIDGVLA
jgi:hypothetical protein